MVEPSGYEMDNWRMGVMASSIVNAIYASIPIPKGSKRPKPLQASDFIPSFKKQSVDLTPEQQAYIDRKHGKRRHRNR